jgi:hypothetical protein
MINIINNILNQSGNISKYLRKEIRIPVKYIVFMITCFLLMNPEYVTLMQIHEYIPDNVSELLLRKINALYTIETVVCVGLGGLILILLLHQFSAFFYKLETVSMSEHAGISLEKGIKYTNGTTDSWNEYAASTRVFNIIKFFSTTFWILYFVLNTLLNNESFIQNNNFFTLSWWLNMSHQSNMNKMSFLLFFIINLLACGKHIIQYFYVLNTRTHESRLTYEEYHSCFTLNSFRFETKGRHTETFEYLFLKRKYVDESRTKFLLVKVQLTKYGLHKNNWNKEETWCVEKLAPSNLWYDVLNSSTDFSEIRYHFESLRSAHTKDS